MHRPGGGQVGDDAGHAIAIVARRRGVDFGQRSHGGLARAAVQDLDAVVAIDQVVVFPLAGAVAIDGQGSQSEQVLHHRADPGGGVVLVFRDGDEDVAIRVGVVHIVGRKQQPATRHGKTRELPGGVGVVGVFELHAGRGAEELPRIPVGVQHVFFEGIRARRRRPLYQADAMRAGPRHQVHGGGKQVRVGPVRVPQRQVSEPHGRAAVEVQFDGDGLALDQPSQASQLVEHAVEDRRQFGGFISLAACDRHRRDGRGRGEAGCGARKEQPGCPEAGKHFTTRDHHVLHSNSLTWMLAIAIELYFI